ncbi:MAG: Do family serine endopeptidase [Xanthobacteraceae bacterium]
MIPSSAATRFAIALFGVVVATAELASAQVSPRGTPLALGSLPQGVSTLAPLVKKVTPSVVIIAVKGRIAQEQNPLFHNIPSLFNNPELPAEREIRSAGSGVIVDARQGLVITNSHVLEHADEIKVVLTDGRRLEAKRVGSDSETDIAVLRVAAEGLTAIAIGDSDKLEVGDFVIAIGDPFALGQTVTSGIVSALGRTGLEVKGYEDFIQTDAPINPGNSGGALVNLHGELVGICTAIIGPSGGNVGIGFAIPTNTVRGVMDQLVQFGEVRRGALGIAFQDLTPDLAQALGLDAQRSGAVIAKVEPGSAAEYAGLKAGDVITGFGQAVLRGSADLRNKITALHVGDAVELSVVRKGRAMTVRATLPAPDKTLKGADISPLLDGAFFRPVSSGAPASGVEIDSVQAGSKASTAGLRKGDIITSVNQEPIAGPEEFAAKVRTSSKPPLLNLARDRSAFFVLLQ